MRKLIFRIMNQLRLSTFALIFLVVCSTRSLAQRDSLFFHQPVDSVLMVEFDWRGKGGEILDVIDEKGHFPSTILRKTVITPKEQAELIHSLNSKKSFGAGHAACFEPHLGFVFYRNGNITGHLTICVGCNYLIPSQEIPAQQQGKQVSEEGEVFYTGTGMSAAFLRKLDRLLEQYHFQYRVSS
jgi:hypothetical protein